MARNFPSFGPAQRFQAPIPAVRQRHLARPLPPERVEQPSRCRHQDRTVAGHREEFLVGPAAIRIGNTCATTRIKPAHPDRWATDQTGEHGDTRPSS